MHTCYSFFRIILIAILCIYIFFILDCCDGSDEWDSGVQCPNTCEDQGSKARENAKKSLKIREIGYSNRLQLAKEGVILLENHKREIEQQNKELADLLLLKSDIELKKKEIEELEHKAKELFDNAWNG